MTRLHLRERFRRDLVWGDALVMLLVSPWTLMTTSAPWLSTGRAAGLPGVLMLAWSLLYTVPLLWRRTRPDVMAAGILVAHLVQLVLVPTVIPANVVVPVAVYALARYAHPRRARAWLAVVLVGCLVGGIQWGWYESGAARVGPLAEKLVRSVAWFVGCAAITLATWFWGQWNRQKDLTHQSWRERAEALEREREQGIRLVAQEERNRLAREMHDIVAHSLSVIVVQADGAGYLAGHAELGDAQARLAQVTRAIETIGTTARTALGETRRLVGVLRDDVDVPAELAPAATLAQIGDLVAQVQAAGVPATFVVDGHPDAHPPLAAGAEMACYRVVQESLTNVLKHAGPGATVTVRLGHTPSGLDVAVTDTGAGATPTDGLGHGVVGMRERVAVWGGSLVARPRPTGGFEVVAHIPANPDQEDAR